MWRGVVLLACLRLPGVTLHFVPNGHEVLSAEGVSGPRACFVRTLSHVLVV